jgi:hypothetical protein
MAFQPEGAAQWYFEQVGKGGAPAKALENVKEPTEKRYLF